MSEQPSRPATVAPDPSIESPSPRPSAPGDVIAGRYRLDSLIATGGMASVWRATDTILTRPVAVKVLLPKLAADPDFVARFRREAVAAARLAHPGIIATYDTCTDPEAIVMELVEGRTLRDELDQRGFLPPAEAVALISQVAVALDAAHKAGVVHRDVKPANVLLSSNGAVKVADFGIAKASSEDADPALPDLTTVGHMVGTAKYLAPEQVSGGDVDARADVYALGAVLYECLCGQPPFDGDNALATATARLHGPPKPPRSVLRTIPASLDRIVMKAMATSPEGRYDSTAAMWADLQAAELDSDTGRADSTITRVVASPAPPSSFARAERSALVPAAVISGIAAALILIWLVFGGTEAGRDLLGVFDSGPGKTESEPVAVTAAAVFDPDPGDNSENDHLVELVFDGDPDTWWYSENYRDRQLGGLKDGVGVIVTLEDATDIDSITATVADPGWAAQVFVADAPGASLGEWNEAVAGVTDAGAGETTIELDGAAGRHILLWFTDLGEGQGVRLSLGEVTVRGR